MNAQLTLEGLKFSKIAPQYWKGFTIVMYTLTLFVMRSSFCVQRSQFGGIQFMLLKWFSFPGAHLLKNMKEIKLQCIHVHRPWHRIYCEDRWPLTFRSSLIRFSYTYYSPDHPFPQIVRDRFKQPFWALCICGHFLSVLVVLFEKSIMRRCSALQMVIIGCWRLSL